MAFVSATPVGLITSSMTGSRVSARSTAPVAQRRSQRATIQASIQEDNRNAKKAAEHRGPQGFTLYSEKVNGRMAMLGFTIGLMTEIINPNHPAILKQVESLIDFIPFVHTLSL